MFTVINSPWAIVKMWVGFLLSRNRYLCEKSMRGQILVAPNRESGATIRTKLEDAPWRNRVATHTCQVIKKCCCSKSAKWRKSSKNGRHTTSYPASTNVGEANMCCRLPPPFFFLSHVINTFFLKSCSFSKYLVRNKSYTTTKFAVSGLDINSYHKQQHKLTVNMHIKAKQ